MCFWAVTDGVFISKSMTSGVSSVIVRTSNVCNSFACEQTLFVLLLQHFGEVCRRNVIPHKLLDGMTRHLYDLTQMSAQHAGCCFAELLADRYKEFTAQKEEEHGKPRYPDLDLVCSLAYVTYLLMTFYKVNKWINWLVPVSSQSALAIQTARKYAKKSKQTN